MLNAAKWRSKQKGLPFDLTHEWVVERISRCELTGLPLDMTPSQRGRQNPMAPSLDRRDSAKGYTRDNTRIVAWGINCALNDFGEGAFRRLAIAYLKATGLT